MKEQLPPSPVLRPELEVQLRGLLAGWHAEVQAILPTLPVQITVEFDNDFVMKGEGTGGVAWDSLTIKLGYDETADTPDNLHQSLRQAYYHEGCHLARDYNRATIHSGDPQSQVADAIEEGLATKFEMLYAGSEPGYAKYEDHATMLDWVAEMKGLPDGWDWDWRRVQFFDPATGHKWMKYKTGVFIVDQALAKSPELTLIDLVGLSTNEILELSGL